MRIKIRDTVYETVHEAAKAFGVKPTAIYVAASRGKLDRIGLPAKGRVLFAPGTKPGNAVTICGKHFPSITAMALFLGRSPSNTLKLWKNGKREKLVLEVFAKLVKEEQEARFKR